MISYNKGEGEFQNWIIEETEFDPTLQGKCETIFALGNGYLGTRSATEEDYVGQVRNTFVAGTFNKCNENEVTELPNAADALAMSILVDGIPLSLSQGSYKDYSRTLNLKTGELRREFVWTHPNGKDAKFVFSRFASMSDLHLMGSRVTITPLSEEVEITIKSGINGQVTNTGAQHFQEGEKRIFDSSIMQMLQKTTESEISFVHSSEHTFSEGHNLSSRFELDRRKIYAVIEGTLVANTTTEITKFSTTHTTRDIDLEDQSLDQIRELAITSLRSSRQKGYDKLLQDSATAWGKWWNSMNITIEGDEEINQLAIRFAQYHLIIMAPRHDERFGIAAKGLTGEGYKGHSFWDTEIFMLPFFTYTFPLTAKKLLSYRYHTLSGARKKAEVNGYRGAMYPWESAWKDDGEVTPVWGAVDIVTGEATKIWSGFIEQHITSDVAFAIWQYYMISGDLDFMNDCGFEILLDTGIFWSSRLEWSEEDKLYHINDVVGPDEYKEHINDDAFTNYMAHWCMGNALKYYDLLSASNPVLLEKLNHKLNLDTEIPEIKKRISKVYLPKENADNVIPQDNTYLSKKIIDLSKYKQQTKVGTLFLDYNLDQVNEIQVSKQASVVMLMYLLENKFSPEVKAANFKYYEPKTLHDSSLSLSTHAILASDLQNKELAYDLFKKASQIDLGPNMKSSDHGIHAASLGGVWQIIVCGFAGIRMLGGELRMTPNLPPQISKLQIPIHWKGNPLKLTVEQDNVVIQNNGTDDIQMVVCGEELSVSASSTFTFSTSSATVAMA